MSHVRRHLDKHDTVYSTYRNEVSGMGLLADIFGTGNKVPTIISILPVAAKQEIEAGRLPILNTDQLFLKKSTLLTRR